MEIRWRFTIPNNPWYVLCVAVLVMPINGWIIGQGHYGLGIALMLLHFPVLYHYILPRKTKDYEHRT
jgi:hypothetical protein